MTRSARLATQLAGLRRQAIAIDATEPDAATALRQTTALSRQMAVLRRLVSRAQAGERALCGGRVSP